MLRSSFFMFGWLLLLLSQVVARDSVPRLTVSGRVQEIQLSQTDPHFVNCRFRVILEFTNRDAEPIIILRQSDHNSLQSFIVGGVSLAKSRADAEAGRYIYDLETWPSVDNSPGWEKLAKELDKKTPPTVLTRVLQPNETWSWSTETQIVFFYRESNQNLGWDQIGEIKEPLWMQFSLGMWPYNLEHATPGIGKRLRHRWRTIGRLWLKPQSAHGILTSEPMIMRLNETRLIDSK